MSLSGQHVENDGEEERPNVAGEVCFENAQAFQGSSCEKFNFPKAIT
jgi:hypothetical protein